MPKIKRKIVTDFTTVQNDFLRDRELGLTERGLLMTMLSLPDNWDYSAAGLASILPDGIKKTRASLQRLEQKGYLKRSRIYENGKVVDWLYEFCEVPIFLEEIKQKRLEAPKVLLGKNLEAQNVPVENVQVGKVQVENGENNKRTKKSNTKKSKSVKNQSINLVNKTPEEVPAELEDRLIDGELLEKIRNQICYCSCIQERPIEKEMVDLIVDSLAQLYVTNVSMTFANATYDPQVIRGRAAQFGYDHVGYVIDSVMAQTGTIHNMPKYILASVFNAPATHQVLEDRNYASG